MQSIFRSSREDPAEDRGWIWLLWGIIAVSVGLRIALVVNGGQQYWPDENRYEYSRRAADLLVKGELLAAGEELFWRADHLFFKIIGLLPALMEQALGRSQVLPALVFAMFSVLNLWLIARVVRAAGGSLREGALSAGIMACSNSLFYFARHFFPYDASLTFGLAGLAGGLSDAGFTRTLKAGVWVGLCFLTYNGYWLFGAVVLGIVTVQPWRNWRIAAARAGMAAAGLALPIGAVLLIGAALGRDLVQSYLLLSRSVTLGDFGAGRWFVPEYFWESEGCLVWLGAGGVGLCVAHALARWRWTRGLLWTGAAAVIWNGLVFFSDVVPKFTVYGRTARSLVPFVCLAIGFLLEESWRAWRWSRVFAAGEFRKRNFHRLQRNHWLSQRRHQ